MEEWKPGNTCLSFLPEKESLVPDFFAFSLLPSPLGSETQTSIYYGDSNNHGHLTSNVRPPPRHLLPCSSSWHLMIKVLRICLFFQMKACKWSGLSTIIQESQALFHTTFAWFMTFCDKLRSETALLEMPLLIFILWVSKCLLILIPKLKSAFPFWRNAMSENCARVR